MKIRALLLVALCGLGWMQSKSQSVWAQDIALMHARVYASPTTPALDDATVLIQHGKITGIGQRVAIPVAVGRVDCRGCIVFAGFWNSHVHFTEEKWMNAAKLPAAQLTSQLQAMLGRSGFTTVVDTASDTVNTAALRQRIDSGEVKGPKIYTAGVPLFPAHALPFYLDELPKPLRDKMWQPETPSEAAAIVEKNATAGADLTKLFTGSIVAPEKVVPMRAEIARAAADAAHKRGELVFAHATNLAGLRIALENGVDVIAHAPEQTDGIDDAMLHGMVERHISIIPTLKLFAQDRTIGDIRGLLLRFHQMGGVLMFGTDTGFLPDYDIGEDYRQLSLAGLSFQDIATTLTTAPAQRFGVTAHKDALP